MEEMEESAARGTGPAPTTDIGVQVDVSASWVLVPVTCQCRSLLSPM
jgi:hypothetical protein